MCIEGMGIAGVYISMDLNFPEEYQMTQWHEPHRLWVTVPEL